jgi:hypothetical protein
MGRFAVNNPYLPATPEQIYFGQAILGIRLSEKEIESGNMGELSERIDEAVEVRPPTQEQQILARELGIDVPEGITFNPMSNLLDEQIKLLTETAGRNGILVGREIAYLGWPFKVTKITIDEDTQRYMAEITPLVKPTRKFINGYRTRTVLLAKLAHCKAPSSHVRSKPLIG